MEQSMGQTSGDRGVAEVPKKRTLLAIPGVVRP